jgi:hypothetical protein
MKDKALVYLSLGLSCVAISYSAWVHHQGSEVLAMRALKQREAELVRHWAPKFEQMFAGLNVELDPALKPPTTLEELFDPVVEMLNRLGQMDEPETNGVPGAN